MQQEAPPHAAEVFECLTASGEKKVRLTLDDNSVTLSGAIAAAMPFEYIVSYEGARVGDVGPAWEIKFGVASWRMYLFAKSITTHTVRLVAPEGFDAKEGEPNTAFANCLVRSIDKRVLRWMRRTAGVGNKSVAVSSVSLLRPQIGIEAALTSIKRESESDESGLDILGVELKGGAPRSRSIATPGGATRQNPGECLFCDEEALEVPGLVVEGQEFFSGPRCLGAWSVWKQGFVSVLVNQELIPAMLILSPGAIVLMLPSANMFVPFPIESIACWGAANDSFSFKHSPAVGVFNVISLNSFNAEGIESTLIKLMDKMAKGTVPANPFPLFY